MAEAPSPRTKVRRLPERCVYEHALSELQVDAGDAWMVGDNLEWEVKAPQELGMKGVWVDIEGRGVPEGAGVEPDKIVRTIAELVLC